MNNALYVGLSRQIVLQREMDIVANNMANADTTGFKVESLMQKTNPAGPATNDHRPVKFVADDGVLRNFGQGGLRRTDAPLDLALDGQGFFQISTPQGLRYTRDGRFRLDDNGKMVTESGRPVTDESGGEISIDPEKGPITIAPDGTITQGDERVGKLAVMDFPALATLEKTGDNLYRNTSNQQPQPATDTKVRQGMLESANVQPILEIARMIEISRAYEQMARMMDSEAELSKSAVQRMGRVQ
jgi:flagellar basal-body rod protein FlgF